MAEKGVTRFPKPRVIYYRQKNGYCYSRTVYGETRRAWVTNRWDFQRPERIKKSEIEEISEAQYRMWLWGSNHKWRISSYVQSINDPDILLAVARLVGYSELPE